MINPYQAPSAPEKLVEPERVERALASPWLRLGGALLDWALMYGAILPGILRMLGTDIVGRDMYLDYMLPIAGPALLLTIVQALLVTARGQSIGKLIVGTRIVRMDGTPAGFLRGVLVRGWLAYCLWVIPVFGYFVGLVDSLMVFRRTRQCAHDMFAGTIVVKVAS